MCGIVGYKGFRNASDVVVHSLKTLEYRGYDSWGIALQGQDSLESIVHKNVGEISKADFSQIPASKIAIGHTRWATHGSVTDFNAHPHFSCDKKITVVHNGIIENYMEIRNELKLKGHKFSSETDSETIPHLIEEFMKTENISFEDAVKKTFAKLEGSFAFIALRAEEIAGARKESPLVAGLGEGNKEFFIASDVTAFLKFTKDAVFLDDNEMVFLNSKNEVSFYNFETRREVKKETKKILWEAKQAQKAGYQHFMLKEIFEQPEAVKNSFLGRIKNNKVFIEGLEDMPAEKLNSINRIILVACGTSYHAALIGEYFFENFCRIQAEVELGSEFRYRNPVVNKNDLVIAISQSGETADTLAAMREAKKKGAKILGIVNVMESTVARESDFTLYTHAGPEIGVASTKAFTTQLSVLFLVSLYLAQTRKTLTEKEIENQLNALQQIPAQMAQSLQQHERVMEVAQKYYRKNNALFLGRGPNYPIALEGALKLKEISYLHSEGCSAAEMKHGPIALIDKEMPVIFVAANDSYYKKNVSNIEELNARNGTIIAIATEGNNLLEGKADEIIFIPETSEFLVPFLSVVPLQLFAYYVADLRGCSIDKPRNLAKSVTVE